MDLVDVLERLGAGGRYAPCRLDKRDEFIDVLVDLHAERIGWFRTVEDRGQVRQHRLPEGYRGRAYGPEACAEFRCRQRARIAGQQLPEPMIEYGPRLVAEPCPHVVVFSVHDAVILAFLRVFFRIFPEFLFGHGICVQGIQRLDKLVQGRKFRTVQLIRHFRHSHDSLCGNRSSILA